MASAQVTRELGNLERFTLSSANVGTPWTLALLAKLPPSANTSVTSSLLLCAINRLLDTFPLLRCAILNGRTQRPSFQLQPQLTAETVLEVVPSCAQPEAELLSLLSNAGESFDGKSGPLWRVYAFEGAGQGATMRIGLAISHTISDGIGAQRLFQRLLKLIHPNHASELTKPIEVNLKLPPTLEETVQVLPTLRTKLLKQGRSLWDQLSTQFFGPPRPPPARMVPSLGKVTPEQATHTAAFRLSPAQVGRLKAVVKARGIGTLHPLIKGAVLTSIFLSQAGDKAEPGSVHSMTAMSVRDGALGHCDATANFAAAHSDKHILSAQDNFFDLCRAYGTKLSLPSTKQQACYNTGSLALLPNPVPTPDGIELNGKKYPATGFDSILLELAKGIWLAMNDVATVNLMRVEPTGWEEEEEGLELSAAQSVGVIYASLVVTVVSSAKGEMALAVNWLEGTLETGAFAERFTAFLESILHRLADEAGVEGIDERATIESLRSSAKAKHE